MLGASGLHKVGYGRGINAMIIIIIIIIIIISIAHKHKLTAQVWWLQSHTAYGEKLVQKPVT